MIKVHRLVSNSKVVGKLGINGLAKVGPTPKSPIYDQWVLLTFHATKNGNENIVRTMDLDHKELKDTNYCSTVGRNSLFSLNYLAAIVV